VKEILKELEKIYEFMNIILLFLSFLPRSHMISVTERENDRPKTQLFLIEIVFMT
jgi:hypothetical protein